jgi:2-succinyl-6-hydroxy-2,4-cyclohexadiene-1-carboxylate synthase
VRLVLVHGFTQTGASWAPITELLQDHDVVCPDLPGHGREATVQADLAETADRLATDRLTTEPAIWVGYSLGGRVCLHLALAHPAKTKGLVLVSTTAGIEDPGERAARKQSDDDLADDIERDGVDAFIARWLRGPLFASLPKDRAGIEPRLTNTKQGLAGSLRRSGAGTQAPLWDRLHEITAPTLVVTGDEDEKFTALGDRLGDKIKHATRARIARAGHALPWEVPEQFADLLTTWISEHY